MAGGAAATGRVAGATATGAVAGAAPGVAGAAVGVAAGVAAPAVGVDVLTVHPSEKLAPTRNSRRAVGSVREHP
jgi:hypothetical protein